jgi:hypothetical protein
MISQFDYFRLYYCDIDITYKSQVMTKSVLGSLFILLDFGFECGPDGPISVGRLSLFVSMPLYI